jgi:hypothetical protein
MRNLVLVPLVFLNEATAYRFEDFCHDVGLHGGC